MNVKEFFSSKHVQEFSLQMEMVIEMEDRIKVRGNSGSRFARASKKYRHILAYRESPVKRINISFVSGFLA